MIISPVCKTVTGTKAKNEARKEYGENAHVSVGGRQGFAELDAMLREGFRDWNTEEVHVL